jgi:hypothetical protein
MKPTSKAKGTRPTLVEINNRLTLLLEAFTELFEDLYLLRLEHAALKQKLEKRNKCA